MVGQTFSHFTITGHLGSGGMGDVYRATDTSLGRDVAIKILPRAVAADADRLARFRREAHLLASLNHPQIAAIYGFQEEQETAFLVLELVEGETLADRIRRGPLPLDEAIDISRQIAEGIEAAHERGVVHRDLKPANIKLTPSGVAKVLDFGVAKAFSGDGADLARNAAGEPQTRTRDDTAVGVIVGTAAYMAPEQVRGRTVDKRADVWAFGVVLYEMLTARRPFTGTSMTDLLAAVVSVDPDWSLLPAETPPAVRRLLRRCLQRDVRHRLPDIGSARLELTEVLGGTIEAETRPAGRPAPTGARRAAPWAIAVLAVAAAAYSIVSVRQRPESDTAQPLTRLTLEIPPALATTRIRYPQISPDGRHVVIVGQERRLHLRHMDAFAFEAMPGTEGAENAFWSPDSRSIGFTVGAHVKVATLSGAVRLLSTLDGLAWEGTWGANGSIVLPKSPAGTFTNDATTLVAVSAADGQWKAVTTLDRSRGEIGHFAPEFLPDGQRVAFFAENSDRTRSALVVTRLDNPAERRSLSLPGPGLRFGAGHAFAIRDGSLLAYPFDLERLEPRGDAVVLATDANQLELGAPFSVSASGVLAYSAVADRDVQLTWVSRNGTPLQRVGRPGPYTQLGLTADERRAVLGGAGRNGEPSLWTLDLVRGIPTLFDADGNNGLWSADGTELIFSSSRGLDVNAVDQHNPNRLFRKSVRQDGRAVAVLPPEAHRSAQMWAKYWTPDRRTLFYLVQHEGHNTVFTVRLDQPSTPVPLALEGELVDRPQLSPDGHWLTYIALEHGRHEVFLEPFGQQGERIRVSLDGGGQPEWRADGRELYYVTAPGTLMAVGIGPDGDLAKTHEPLFDIVGAAPYLQQYAPGRDGQRFLVMLPVPSGLSPLRLVSGWQASSGGERSR